MKVSRMCCEYSHLWLISGSGDVVSKNTGRKPLSGIYCSTLASQICSQIWSLRVRGATNDDKSSIRHQTSTEAGFVSRDRWWWSLGLWGVIRAHATLWIRHWLLAVRCWCHKTDKTHLFANAGNLFTPNSRCAYVTVYFFDALILMGIARGWLLFMKYTNRNKHFALGLPTPFVVV